jgi:hypothetical protein
LKCLNKKIILFLKTLNKNVNKNLYDMQNNNNNNDVVEGFFPGFNNIFNNSSTNNLPVSTGSYSNENLDNLEKKINDKMMISNNFPPVVLNSDINDFNNSSLTSSFIDNKPKELPLKEKKEEQTIQSILGTCQFFNDTCPQDYYPLGNFSVQGVGNSSVLMCGNVQNTKPAKAIAQIKNNALYEIYITDQGHGFNPKTPPKVSIEGGKGHGATAEAIVDDDGFLKIIKIINPGYNYTETPNILIDTPFMNSSCHLCCKK